MEGGRGWREGDEKGEEGGNRASKISNIEPTGVGVPISPLNAALHEGFEWC